MRIGRTTESDVESKVPAGGRWDLEGLSGADPTGPCKSS